MRQDLGSMSPMDAVRFFEPIRENAFAVDVAPTVIAEQNSRRVALVVFGFSATTVFITTRFDFAQLQQGRPVKSGLPDVVMTHRDVGPLVQERWWLNQGVGGTVGVIEVVLKQWPGERGPPAWLRDATPDQVREVLGQ